MATTFKTGRRAEAAAAAFLTAKGCEIIEQNWRTRRCEIDVVACRGSIVYFVEVKYRRTNSYGAGLEYVTPKKLEQMRFAARTWVHAHAWRGEFQLCAIEVSGENFRVTNVVKALD